MMPNRQTCAEITGIFIFLLLVLLLNYFLILNNIITVFIAEKKQEKNLVSMLLQKKTISEKNALVKKSILIWQQKNPALYDKIKKPSDYLISEITALIQNTGFTISQIQPLLHQNKGEKDKDLFLEATLKGNYFLLFYLLGSINQNPWPIQLIDIKIKSKDRFQLHFALRDRND